MRNYGALHAVSVLLSLLSGNSGHTTAGAIVSLYLGFTEFAWLLAWYQWQFLAPDEALSWLLSFEVLHGAHSVEHVLEKPYKWPVPKEPSVRRMLHWSTKMCTHRKRNRLTSDLLAFARRSSIVSTGQNDLNSFIAHNGCCKIPAGTQR